jgi:hypothetical protein
MKDTKAKENPPNAFVFFGLVAAGALGLWWWRGRDKKAAAAVVPSAPGAAALSLVAPPGVDLSIPGSLAASTPVSKCALLKAELDRADAAQTEAQFQPDDILLAQADLRWLKAVEAYANAGCKGITTQGLAASIRPPWPSFTASTYL